MLKFFRGLFGGVRPGVMVVERESPYDARLDDEGSIAMLESHPGFIALTNRFKLQRAVLRARLETNVAKDLYEVYNLQNGLKWLDYARAEVSRAVNKKKEVAAITPHPSEKAQFDQVLALIEGV